MSSSFAASAFDPGQQARSDPYYKRNHMGKVACTLCNIYCSDDIHFLKHLGGKTHILSLERMRRRKSLDDRLEEEARLSRMAAEKAALQKAARDALLMQQQQTSPGYGKTASGGSGAASARLTPYGKPLYHFRTESNQSEYEAKVWLEFLFKQASDNSRPLHRWVSAREQSMEKVTLDATGKLADVVYLLVACEGYETVAVKFPASLSRTSAEADTENGRYMCTWNPLNKLYSLFFILS